MCLANKEEEIRQKKAGSLGCIKVIEYKTLSFSIEGKNFQKSYQAAYI